MRLGVGQLYRRTSLGPSFYYKALTAFSVLSVQPRMRTNFSLAAWSIGVENVASQTRSTPWKC